jgi:hypothetical protein
MEDLLYDAQSEDDGTGSGSGYAGDEEEEETQPQTEEIKKTLPRIDLNNDFSIVEITRKANAGEYLKPNGAINEILFISDLLKNNC